MIITLFWLNCNNKQPFVCVYVPEKLKTKIREAKSVRRRRLHPAVRTSSKSARPLVTKVEGDARAVRQHSTLGKASEARFSPVRVILWRWDSHCSIGCCRGTWRPYPVLTTPSFPGVALFPQERKKNEWSVFDFHQLGRHIVGSPPPASAASAQVLPPLLIDTWQRYDVFLERWLHGCASLRHGAHNI